MAAGGPPLTTHPFWDWSLRVYRRRGVAAACVALQDRHRLDVNVLLYVLWRAVRTDRPLDAAGLDRSDAAVARWRTDVVRPLRAVRRGIKHHTDAPAALGESLRAGLQDLEIGAEHIQQLMLGATGPAIEAPPAAATALPRAARGAALLATRLDGAPDAADRADLTTVMTAALDNVTAATVDRALIAALARARDSA